MARSSRFTISGSHGSGRRNPNWRLTYRVGPFECPPGPLHDSTENTRWRPPKFLFMQVTASAVRRAAVLRAWCSVRRRCLGRVARAGSARPAAQELSQTRTASLDDNRAPCPDRQIGNGDAIENLEIRTHGCRCSGARDVTAPRAVVFHVRVVAADLVPDRGDLGAVAARRHGRVRELGADRLRLWIAKVELSDSEP